MKHATRMIIAMAKANIVIAMVRKDRSLRS